MKTITRLNNPAEYRHKLEEHEIPTATIPAFALHKGETIRPAASAWSRIDEEKVLEMLDRKDIAIIEEVGRSKYLTSLQIFEFLRLRGMELNRDIVRRRLNKLIKNRCLQEKEIVRTESERGLKYYEIDGIGYRIANNQGVIFNRGNCYYSFRRKQELGITDDPLEVKRILTGNQIVLGLLLSGAEMERFAIMETLRIDTDRFDLNACILRTAAMIWINSESVLAYDVVRDCPEGYDKLKDKVQRYYGMLSNRNYLNGNYHGDTSYPQLIVCGESLDHNRRIAEFLKRENLWRSEDPILFTEDLLNMKNSLCSIYAFGENGELYWYSLPGVNANEPAYKLSA